MSILSEVWFLRLLFYPHYYLILSHGHQYLRSSVISGLGPARNDIKVAWNNLIYLCGIFLDWSSFRLGTGSRTTLCEPVRSKCTSASHKSHFMRKFARAQSEHPDQAPAFAPTIRTPQCGDAVLGINTNKKIIAINR